MGWLRRDERSLDGGALGRAAVPVLASMFLAHFVLSSPTSGDYGVHTAVAGDNAGPVLSALAHGHLAVAVAHQPLMALTSILLRLPFVLAAAAMGLSNQQVYAVGALACLIPAGMLAGWVVARRPADAGQFRAAAAAAILILAGPATLAAVEVGHPEEVLAAALATGAVLAATGGRRTWAWVLLGFAAGTKQWALLAFPCVLFALPDGRVAVTVKAGLLAVALTATMPLADPAAFGRADSSVGGITSTDPFSLWWPLSHAAHLALAGNTRLIPLGLTRSEAAAGALLVVLCGLWLYGAWRRRARIDVLALLGLVGLARCITDPDPLKYNFVAVLIPLAVWEAIERRRFPWVTALASACVALLATGSIARFVDDGVLVSPNALSGLSIAWTVMLGGYLAYCTFERRQDLPRLAYRFQPQ